MSNLNLFTSAAMQFSGFQKGFKEADYVIVGVPFDATSTYRSGARFAPSSIREASLNIETYSFRSGIDIEDLSIHDAGDLHVSGDVNETLRRVEIVCSDILSNGKVPVFIGGEHTITFGAAKNLRSRFAVVSFDAHLDLRDEYMDRKFCHATFMRRINEIVKPEKIIEIGVRAACKDELKYVAEAGNIIYVTPQKIENAGVKKISEEIKDLLVDCEEVYLTVDMDVLDPSYAPAVQNPEPDGLSIGVLLNILSLICDRRIVGFDIVEVTPHYDNGVTAINAAKIIFEVLSFIYKSRLFILGDQPA
jgi:agmatinase